MNFRIQPIHERPIACGAHRRRHPRTKAGRLVLCERPALHGFGCSLTDEQLAKHPDVGSRRLLRNEARWHAGRDRQGKWYFWEDER